jgi:hypothetical protein
MFQRLLLVGLLSCMVGALYAQGSTALRKPDYQRIEQATKNAASSFYYPKLFKRYLNNDTTLTQTDFHYLYYGFFFCDDKERFNPGYYKDSLDELYKKESLTDADKKKAIKYAKEDLKLSPFRLNDLNVLCTIYYEMGDIANYSLYKYKFKSIAQVIILTGDGRSITGGFHVLEVNDEYAIMSAFGLEVAGHKTIDNKCDYLEAKENSQGVKGLYFDVRQIFDSYYRVPKQEKDGAKK